MAPFTKKEIVQSSDDRKRNATSVTKRKETHRVDKEKGLTESMPPKGEGAVNWDATQRAVIRDATQRSSWRTPETRHQTSSPDSEVRMLFGNRSTAMEVCETAAASVDVGEGNDEH